MKFQNKDINLLKILMLKIAVIGSGWGSGSFIKYIDNDKYDVKVISPNNHFIYTPLLANKVRKGTVSGFQNMTSNKLNPYEISVGDDIPMKVYYGLLGVGGIYLLYQLSKKYGIKLNLD